MNKKVMCDLLDKAETGDAILKILDALCDIVTETTIEEDETEPTDDDLVEGEDLTQALVEIDDEVLDEPVAPRKKGKTAVLDKDLVEF